MRMRSDLLSLRPLYMLTVIIKQNHYSYLTILNKQVLRNNKNYKTAKELEVVRYIQKTELTVSEINTSILDM